MYSDVWKAKHDEETGDLVLTELDYQVNAEIELEVPVLGPEELTLANFSLNGKEFSLTPDKILKAKYLKGKYIVVIETISEFEDWVSEKEYFIQKKLKVHVIQAEKFIPQAKIIGFENRQNLSIVIEPIKMPIMKNFDQLPDLKASIEVFQTRRMRLKKDGKPDFFLNWYASPKESKFYDREFSLAKFYRSQGQYILSLHNQSDRKYYVHKSKKTRVEASVSYDFKAIIQSIEKLNPNMKVLNRELDRVVFGLESTFE